MKKFVLVGFLCLFAPSAFGAGGLTWSHLVLGFLEEPLAEKGIDPLPVLDMLFVVAGLIIFAYFGGKPFRQSDMLEPSGKANFSHFIEVMIRGIYNFLSGIIQHGVGARPLFPLLGTYALFILSMNLLGLIPGFNPPTDQFNVTLPFALIIFVTTHYLGIRINGSRYLKQFTGPLWWLAPLMFPIELITHCVRPMSLSIRLFGNMTGDHKVVAVFTAILAVGLPIPFMGLGVLISFLQAFVFVLLSAIYFESAMSEAH
jgi:F-type H+-transporting ATPase subunit a